ncbi:hypothetical protein NKH77_30630 [Streptomyces sp. M19]
MTTTTTAVLVPCCPSSARWRACCSAAPPRLRTAPRRTARPRGHRARGGRRRTAGRRHPVEGATRLADTGSVPVDLALHVDGFAALVAVLVGAVATCVQLYSTGYLRDDPRYPPTPRWSRSSPPRCCSSSTPTT